MRGLFMWIWLGLQRFLPLTQSLLVFASGSCGDLPSWHWNSGLWGPGVGLGLLAPKVSLPNVYPPLVVAGAARSAPEPLLPVWMDVVSLISWLSGFHST